MQLWNMFLTQNITVKFVANNQLQQILAITSSLGIYSISAQPLLFACHYNYSHYVITV